MILINNMVIGGSTLTYKIRRSSLDIRTNDNRGFVVLKNLSSEELSNLKLRIFRVRKGTLRPFFAKGTVNNDLNQFVDAAQAQTADFIFPLEQVQVNGSNDRVFTQSIVKFNTIIAEFNKIVKEEEEGEGEDTAYRYIGFKMGQRKGIYIGGSDAYHLSEQQKYRMYTLYAALINNKYQVLSNYILLRPFYDIINQTVYIK